MKKYLNDERVYFKLTDKVRDYECDLQGVVNNSNYQHYMEHTRHEFLESLGENFGKMHEKGVDGFVSRVEIQYKTSLKSGDSYISCLNVYKRVSSSSSNRTFTELPTMRWQRKGSSSRLSLRTES